MEVKDDLQNFTACLLDVKTKVEKKLKSFKTFHKLFETNHLESQFLFDWLCTTLEFVSKNEKLVLANVKVIEELLGHLNERLTEVDHRSFSLKINIAEVLQRFSRKGCPVDSTFIFVCWKLVLENPAWINTTQLKLGTLVDVIAFVCYELLTELPCRKELIHVSILSKLLALYKRQVKTQYNQKKIFMQFCEKLLTALFIVRTVLVESNMVGGLQEIIDELFSLVVCNKLHIASLKFYLNINENDIVVDEVEEKRKKRENDVYFKTVIDQLALHENKRWLMKGFPFLYKKIINGSRILPVTDRLTHYEEFDLLVRLQETCHVAKGLEDEFFTDAIQSLESTLKVVAEYDIYQHVDDAAKGSHFYSWMMKMFDQMMTKRDGCVINVLMSAKSLLSINHGVVESYLSEIWEMCLVKSDNLEIANTKNNLLCEVLSVYSRLYQLDKLLGEFTVPRSSPQQICYPPQFIEKYALIITCLDLSHVHEILEIFLGKLSKSVENESLLKTDGLVLLHETYMLFYLVVVNGNLIPVNGYMRPPLQLVMDMLQKFQCIARKINNNQQNLKHPMEAVALLIEYSISSVDQLLCSHSLKEPNETTLELINYNLDASALCLYLKACLCIQHLSTSHFSCCVAYLENLSIKYLSDHHVQNVIWNKELMALNEEMLPIALIFLLEANLQTFIHYNCTTVVDLLVKAVWNMETRFLWKSTCLRQIHSYNSHVFQATIVHVAVSSINEVFQNEAIEQSDKERMRNLFKTFESLPLHYMTEQHLLNLFNVLFDLLKERIKDDKELAQLCFCLLNSIINVSLMRGSKCEINVAEVFKTSFKFYLKGVFPENENFNILSRAIVKYSPKDDPKTVAFYEEICSNLKSNTKKTVKLTSHLLTVMANMLKQPVMSSRNDRNIQAFLSHVGTVLMKEKLVNKIDAMFVSMCCIVQHAQIKKGENSSLKFLEDDLVGIFATLSNRFTEDLQDDATKAHCVSFLQFLHSFNHHYEFTLRLMSEMTYKEDDIVSTLLNHHSATKRNATISAIVLSTNENTLENLLENLSETFVACVRDVNEKDDGDGMDENDDGDEKDMVSLWITLLTSKWEKEQRVTLWRTLPKVMLTCVHLMTRLRRFDEITSALQLLIAIVNLSKHSLMSQYVSCIYHIYPTLLDTIHLLPLEKFAYIFEALFHLSSQLLFQHQSAVYTTVHVYLNCVKGLLNAFATFSNKAQGLFPRQLSQCCEKLARLYKEIGNHKAVMCKYAPYMIMDYVTTCQIACLPATDKGVLDGGIHCIFDICTEYEFSLLNVLIEPHNTELYHCVKTSFEKHHKYQGKA